jgi:hypothetical protein
MIWCWCIRFWMIGLPVWCCMIAITFSLFGFIYRADLGRRLREAADRADADDRDAADLPRRQLLFDHMLPRPGRTITLFNPVVYLIIRDDCRRVPLELLRHPCEHRTGGAGLGCLAVAWWAAEADPRLLARVEGALLVAPPDVDRPGAHPAVASFRPAPRRPLPFRSILVASRDDPYASFESLAALAKDWGSRLVDVGRCGHINTDSDLALWPEGEALLDELIGDRRSSD